MAIGRALMNANEILATEKGIVVKIERVIMDPNIYPKTWRQNKELIKSN